jgi:hypothetical protein
LFEDFAKVSRMIGKLHGGNPGQISGRRVAEEVLYEF